MDRNSADQALEKNVGQFEAALRESEKNLRLLTKNLPGIVYKGYKDWSVELLDGKVNVLTGYDAAEFNSGRMKWNDIIVDRDIDDVKKSFIKALKSDRSFVREYRIRTSAGTLCWIQDRGQIVCDENGEVEHVIGIFFDITDQKNSERLVRRGRSEWESTFNAIFDWVSLIDLEGRILNSNRAAETILGVPAERILGRSCFQVTYNTDTPVPGCPLARMLKTRQRESLEFHVTDRDVWWMITVDPVFDENGKLASGIHIVRDITRHKQTDLALKESEIRFQELAENIDACFWLSNRDRSKMLYVSPAYEKLWGRTCRSLYDDPASWFDAVYPEDRHGVLTAGETESEEKYSREYRIIKPDGNIRWIRERSFPIRDETGDAYRVAGIATDITEEMRLRSESDDRLRQIIQSDRLAALGAVVAGVAHEINNPNSFIAYNVPLLKETWEMFKPILEEYAPLLKGWKQKNVDFKELMQDMEEIIDAIGIGSERISGVVDNLKDFARLDTSTHTRPVDINEVVEKTLSIVGAQLRRSAEKIDLKLAENLPTIKGHSQKLEQVFANFLVNAENALRGRKKGVISITTRYVERLGSVLVEVEDNGHGLEQKHVDRIFEPFFTTRRNDGGTGLGLSVSYGLVQEHNGRIGVLSRPGVGTRFTVFLPVDEDVRVDINPTILCVDDDPYILKMLRSKFLRADQRSVETMHQPKSVLEFLEQHPEVDIVLSDVMMPGINGWELLEQIKKRFPLMPVILYSGYPEELERNPVGQAMPEYTFEKPFDSNALMQAIHAIGRQRL
ncbi:MAG: PAS domain-containing protein [Pseudomonadota bacterium]